MNKETAKELIQVLTELDAHFSKVSVLTQQIENEEERLEIRQGLGDVIGRTYTEVMVPILKQYPELDPDQEE